MKRLFKMLSLLSILLILGSCSSSKSINVSEFYTDSGYILITFNRTAEDLSGYTYSLVGDVTVLDNSTGVTADFGSGNLIEEFFIVGHTYTYWWRYTSTNPADTSGIMTLSRPINQGQKTRRVSFFGDTISISSN